MKKTTLSKFNRTALALCGAVALSTISANAEPLKIAYSDWPGWTAWDIAQQKGFFKKHDVKVDLVWLEYGASLDAFAGGSVDAVGCANSDSMVLNATGARNLMVLINDYSNGNDKIVGGPGIKSIKDLKGKKVGVEIGCLSHAMLLHSLKVNGMTESDIELVNMPTHQAVQTLESGDVSAIVAWQPHSGLTLSTVKGSNEIFTSADAPGIIYDMLVVSPKSLMANRAEWQKVVDAWYDVIDFIKDPANEKEVLQILSARVGISSADYKGFMKGTKFLTREEALGFITAKTDGLDSVYGSSVMANKFLIENKIYDKSVDAKRCIDPSFTKNVKK